MRRRPMTGSFENRTMETQQPGVQPKAGDGATIVYYTDRHACTVVDVSANGKLIAVREDRSLRMDSNGRSESQDYRFEPDPNAPMRAFSLRRNGLFVEVGGAAHNGIVLRLGTRQTYIDPSF